MNMGEIIPFCHEEVLANDLIEMSVDGLIRFSPLVTPLMHSIKATFMWIFVPTRVIDPTFEDFITGGVDGNDTTTLPTISTGTSSKKTNYHYLGVPKVDNLSFLAHSVYAYNSIYNNLFRDPDLEQTEVANTSTDIQYVMFEKDYFTVARPSASKGTAVTISFDNDVDISGIGINTGEVYTGTADLNMSDGTTYTTNDTSINSLQTHTNVTGIKALTSNLTTSLETFKEAWAFNEYQENRYKYGSKFVEYCRFLGGNVGDARLQRPEVLGISSANISINEVLQTSPDATTSTSVGEMKGHGIAGIRGRRATKHFGEPGQLIGLMYIRPQAIYTNALHRKFSRVDKEDFFQPEFSNLGWQAIKCKELNAQGTAGGTDDDDTYAYVPRYDDYRGNFSRVSGDFIDNLDTWHLARQITGKPVNNKAHISTENNIRNADVFASTANDTIYVLTNNRLKARRIVTPREPMAFIRN